MPPLQAELLRDPGGQLGVRDFASPELRKQGRWQTVQGGALALGVTTDVIWLRLVLPAQPAGAQSAERWLVVGLPFIDEMHLFSSGTAQERPLRAGDHVPVAERPTGLREAAFPLQLQAQPSVAYLRVRSTSTLSLRLQLWEPLRYAEHAAGRQALQGLLQGLMITSAVISLLAGFLLRQTFFFVVAAYLVCFGALHLVLNGYDQLLLYPASPWWADRSVGVLGYGATFLMLAFAASYLQPAALYPRLMRGLQALAAVCAAGVLGSALGFYPQLTQLLSLCAGLSVLLLVALNVLMFRHQRERASLLALMFLPGLLAASLQILRNLGLLPPNFWTTGLWELTALLQMPFAAVVVLLQMRQEQRRLAQVQRREREQQDFLNLMAHELRTPLAVLGAALTNIELRTEAQQPEMKPRFQRAATALQRLNVLVDNALAENRLRDGSLSMDPQPTRPSQLLEQLQPLLLVEAPHTLNVQMPADDSALLFDAQWLSMAVLNLVDNAVKYSPGGGTVALAVERVPGLLRLSVRDQGSGVPAAEHKALFTRFFRASNASQAGVPGIGLGLFLVSEVARRHGGEVKVDSEPGGGSCFTIEIPARVAPA